MSGTKANPTGITNPPIDDLLTKADSKYALVIYGAKRARQINAYYSQLQEGLLEYIGPLVDAQVHDKPLSISLREINDGLLTKTARTPEDRAQQPAVPADVPAEAAVEVPAEPTVEPDAEAPAEPTSDDEA